MTSFRLSYYYLLNASSSSDLRNSRTVKWKHDDFNSVLADWVCIYLSSIFTVRNALWCKKKASLIYIVNCLNRGTDLNRLLISLSQINKMQNQNMRVLWALWHVGKCLNIMIHRILVSTSLCYFEHIYCEEWRLWNQKLCASVVCIFYSVNRWEIINIRAITEGC